MAALDPDLATFEQSQAALERHVLMECKRRIGLYKDLRAPKTPKAASFSVRRLWEYAEDPVAFITDFGWSPDPHGQFGSRKIPDGYSPRGMVPLLVFPKQYDYICAIVECLNASQPMDFVMDKTRQVAATTFGEWVLGMWSFLFRKATTGLYGTYDEDLIDQGGKGQRDPVSLFGRQRMFVDALVWSNPNWRFNQHLAPKRRGKSTFDDRDNRTGFLPHQDIKFKMSRPEWYVHGQRMFQGAEGNWIRGQRPGDKFGRTLTMTWALLDELGHYVAHIGQEADRKAWAASTRSCRVRVGQGTIPRGGGQGTLLREFALEGQSSATRKMMSMHWSDLPPYMAGATWLCQECNRRSAWTDPARGPSENGRQVQCPVCANVVKVEQNRRVQGSGKWPYEWQLMTPWFVRECERMGWDLMGIECELQRNWHGSIGDRFFHTWDETQIRKLDSRHHAYFLEGFNPGRSINHPASWWLIRMNTETVEPQWIGYWTQAHTSIEWWVPFFRRWTPEQLGRMTVKYGMRATDRGLPFLKAFDYSPEALDMLQRVSRYPTAEIEGDKWGTHQHMVESPYSRLEDWRIFINSEYTKDREGLVAKARDWAARLLVDVEIADIQPMDPEGKPYPSPREILMGAKPKPHTGQGEYKLDIDSQDPPRVRVCADPLVYIARRLPENVHAAITAGGDMYQAADAVASQPFNYTT